MAVYAVTGSASGMGAAVVERLLAAGHRVVTVDLRDADVVADLSTPEGRRDAVEKVLAAVGGRLDGAVLAAGLGPAPGRERPALITRVNYLGVVELLEGWREALAATGDAKVVVFSSNSTSTMPLIPARAVRALLDGDVERAVKAYRIFGKGAPAMAYGASKVAVTRWVRRRAVEPEWVQAGIRLNAIAPGAVLTPLLEKQLATPGEAKAIRSFPVPAGGYGDPGLLADWVIHMLGPAADFMVGSVVVVDGGTDAWFRADDWPRPVPGRRLRGYLRRMREFRRTRR
ncbi:SDR family oxidoreductase [Nocardioides sp. CCNWLW239]|uniref:SDR family oxidoreductase n=1 Tax=Nocardioides sp. CCNWLW239 TaxID=3128902 RepID=UPI0030195BE1